MAGTPEGVFLRSTDQKKKTRYLGGKKLQATSKAKKMWEKPPKRKGKGERGRQNDREDNFSHRLPGPKKRGPG